jgi:hypothetical protein
MEMSAPVKQSKPRKPYVRKVTTDPKRGLIVELQQDTKKRELMSDISDYIAERKRKRRAKFDAVFPEKAGITLGGKKVSSKQKVKVPSAPMRPPVKRSINKEKKAKVVKNLTESCAKCDRGDELVSAHTVLLSFQNGQLVSVKQEKTCATTKVCEVGSSETEIPKIKPETTAQILTSVSSEIDKAISEAVWPGDSNSSATTKDTTLVEGSPVVYFQYDPEAKFRGESVFTVSTTKPNVSEILWTNNTETQCDVCGLYDDCICN